MSLRLILTVTVVLTYTSLFSQVKDFKVGQEYSIYSEVLEEERSFYVHVPAEFYGMDSANVEYPTLYVLDGESMFLTVAGITSQMTSAYVAGDLIPQMIVVGIPNINRMWDLSPSSASVFGDTSFVSQTGGGSKFLDFVEKELIPFVDSSFATAPHRTLIGHSLGGLTVLQALLEKPHTFNNFLSIDPDLSWDEEVFMRKVLDTLRLRDFSYKRLFVAGANTTMSWMSEEEVRKDAAGILRFLKSNLAFQEEVRLINNRSLDIELRFYEDENHFQIPVPAIYDGLRHLFRNYSFRPMVEYYHPSVLQTKPDIVEALTVHFSALSEEMGYEVKPLESYINSWAFGFDSLGHPEITESLLKYNRGLYPDSRHTREALKEFMSKK